MAVTGTNRLSFRPGERVPESRPADAGVYDLLLLDAGKQGRQGWTAKPGKFHCRRTSWEMVGTEDEITGAPKKLTEYVTLSPKALFRVLLLAQAAGYDQEFDLEGGYTDPKSPALLANADAVDGLLTWIKENGVVMRANVVVDEFNGRESNKVGKWLAPEEGLEEAADEAEPAEEFEEEEAPAKRAPTKAAPKRR